MSSSDTIPILFTLPPSARHEIILLDTSSKLTLKSLNAKITATIADSPNCAEFMAKHKPQSPADGPKEQIQEMRVRWSESGRDRKAWPEATALTEANLPAVVEMLKYGAGKDVLEVKMGKDE